MMPEPSASPVMYRPNDEPVKGYRLNRLIGLGAFSEVWECQAPLGMTRAMKIVPVNKLSSPLNRELAGLKCMRSIRHTYLLAVEHYDVIDSRLFVVMTLGEKTLADRFNDCVADGLKGIPRDELLPLIVQAAEALDFLHREHGFLHLDVKPGNLMLYQGQIRVGDYGRTQADDNSNGIPPYAYTPAYACPEVLRGRIDPTADQFSLAVTYQELLTGHRPIAGTEPHELLRNYERGNVSSEGLTSGDIEVLRQAYDPDPSRRFVTCTLLAEALCEVTGMDSSVYMTPQSELSAMQSGIFAVKKGPTGDTATGKRMAATPIPAKSASSSAMSEEGNDGKIHRALMGNLPESIYATKLKAFIDTLGAEVVNASESSTLLRIKTRGMFSFGGRNMGIFIQIDSRMKPDTVSQRLIDATVWSTDPKLQNEDLRVRAEKIMNSLAAFTLSSPRR